MSNGSERFASGGESSPRHAKGKQTSWSNSPKGSPRNRPRRPDECDAKKVQQMQAYVAWTNSQLKKLPEGRHVEDLARDMQDGVALAQLIEVVAGEKINIDPAPSSSAIMKDNVEKVLHFISTRKIRLHHVTAKDIVSGNLKSVMRLILALAAHFKPSSVRTPVSEPRPGRRVRRTESSLSAVAADAAATLHDVSKAAASVGTPYHGSRFRSANLLHSSPSTSSIDSNEKDSKISSLRLSMSSESSKISLAPQSDKTKRRGEKQRLSSDGSVILAEQGRKGPDDMRKALSRSNSEENFYQKNSVGKRRVAVSCHQWKEIVEGYAIMEEDLRETRKKLLCLQEVLLNQDGAGEDESEVDGDFSSLDGTLLQEQVTMLNARLDQRSSEYDELKTEFHRTREECINLQGIKQGLQSRLSDQEQVMMKLKAELLKLSFAHQTANSDKSELQRLLEERDREIALLRSELISKDKQMNEQNEKLESSLSRVADMDSVEKDLRSKIKKHEVNSVALRSQVKELQQKLRSVGASEAKISNRITYQDRRVTLLEDKLLRDQSRPKPEEMETIRHCLRSLRNCFASHDPHHHTLDALEETLTSVVDCAFIPFPGKDIHKLHPRNNNWQNGFSDRTETGQAVSRDVGAGTLSTTITYYPSWSLAPSVITISKRLGEVTLRDFKSLLDQPGEYRYYFKALDPEFGTIREELINDDDVIPGWDGKIMAWVTAADKDSSGHVQGRAVTRSETDL